MTFEILVVDDHAPFRQAVRSLLDAEPDIEVVAEADDGETAITLATRLAPDVVVIDLGLPGTNGIEATRQIVATLPRCAVIVLSIHTEPQLVAATLAAGAAGFVAKDTAGRHLIDAVHAVHTGSTFLSPGLSATPSGS